MLTLALRSVYLKCTYTHSRVVSDMCLTQGYNGLQDEWLSFHLLLLEIALFVSPFRRRILRNNGEVYVTKQ